MRAMDQASVTLLQGAQNCKVNRIMWKFHQVNHMILKNII
jgi:hypothetical protein